MAQRCRRYHAPHNRAPLPCPAPLHSCLRLPARSSRLCPKSPGCRWTTDCAQAMRWTRRNCGGCSRPPCPTRASTRQPAGSGRRTFCLRAATWMKTRTPTTTPCSSLSGSAGTSGSPCPLPRMHLPTRWRRPGRGCALASRLRPPARTAWCANTAPTTAPASPAHGSRSPHRPGRAPRQPARWPPAERVGARCWPTGAWPRASAAPAGRCVSGCMPRSPPRASRR